MNAVLDFFGGAAGKALVAALLHSVWIGGVAAAVVGVALRRLHESRVRARVRVALAGQFFTFGATVALWAFLQVGETRGSGPAREAEHAAATAGAVARPGAPAGAVAQPGSSATAGGAAAAAPFVERVAEQVPPPWQAWGGLAWLAGVAFSLARAAASMRAAGRLRRTARPVVDAGLLEILARQCGRLGLQRRVELLVSESAAGACVLGWLRPAIVLPAAWVTGCAPAVLEAVIAHELSHVRHRDYLVNALQLVAEALLFFNPAMRLLGAWARAEREARCDAEAAGTAEAERVRYAEALLVCHRLAAGLPPALAATPALLGTGEAGGGGGEGGGGRERVRRLFRPGRGARPPLPRALLAAAVLTLAVAAAVLFGASRLLAERLSAGEKIDRIAEIQRHYGWVRANSADALERSKEHDVKRLRVTVRTEEGGAPPPGWKAKAVVELPGVVTSMIGTRPAGDDAFLVDVPAGELELAVEAEGYAPTLVAAKAYRSTAEIPDELTLILRHGSRLPIRLVDARTGGAPAKARVTVTASFPSGGMLTGRNEHRVAPDAEGRFWLEQIDPALSMALRIEAEGYATLAVPARVYRADEVPEWRLVLDRPATGWVVDAATGAPVVGAQMRTAYREEIASGRSHHWDERSGPLLASSDADGRYQIAGLEEGMTYGVWVTAPGYARVMLQGVAPGLEAPPLGLEPALSVKGRVLLPAWYTREHVELSVVQDVQVKHSMSGIHPPPQRYVVREGVAEFDVGGLGRLGTRLQVLGQWLGWQTFEQIPAEVVWDLRELPRRAERPRRRVELRFVRDEDAPPPAGAVRIEASFDAPRIEGESVSTGRRSFPVKDGRVEFTLPVPNTFEISAGGLIGYAFDRQSHEVVAGPDPMVIELPVTPTGAIYGTFRTRDAPGTVDVSVARSRWLRENERLEDVAVELGTEPEGLRFFLTPLRLGDDHVLELTRGNTWARFALPALTEREPVRKVDLELPPLVDVRGRVLDPEGRPLRAVSVQLYGEIAEGRHRSGGTTRTDDDGGFVFAGVNPAFAIDYRLKVAAEKGFALRRVRLPRRALERPLEIKLRPGLVLEGELVDAAGRPLPGVQVIAVGENERFSMNMPLHATSDACVAEAPTDGRGRFRFSNLPDSPVRLLPMGADGWAQPSDELRVDPRTVREVRMTRSE